MGAFDTLLRPGILAAARSDRMKRMSQRWAATERVVRRFVAGETLDDVLAAMRPELDDGLSVTVDHLGEDTTDEARAEAAVAAILGPVGA